MGEKLQATIKAYPIPTPSGAFTWHYIFHQPYIFVPALAAVILIVTSGVTLAAHGALPGQVLYPVKLAAEQVELALSPSVKIRAQVATEQAVERLAEAEQLEAGGKLDGATNDRLKQAFKNKAQSAVKNITALAKDDQNEGSVARADFSGYLKAHHQTLVRLQLPSQTLATSTVGLVTAVAEVEDELTVDSSTTPPGLQQDEKDKAEAESKLKINSSLQRLKINGIQTTSD